MREVGRNERRDKTQEEQAEITGQGLRGFRLTKRRMAAAGKAATRSSRSAPSATHGIVASRDHARNGAEGRRQIHHARRSAPNIATELMDAIQ